VKRVVVAVAGLLLIACGWWWLTQQGRGPGSAGVAIGGGDGGGLPRATPVEEHMSTVALTAARATAQQRKLDFLLVARHGHLLLDYFATPEQQDRLLNGGALSDAVMVQLGEARPAEAVALAGALSRQVWQPLNARSARLIGGRVHARAMDWLRVALLLLGGGQFEGTEISNATRVADVHYESAAPSGEALAHRDARELRAPGGVMLWLVPSLQLAVLHGGGTVAGADTLLINQLIRGVEDRDDHAVEHALLNQLVPGH
jgi:hypothetical protein